MRVFVTGAGGFLGTAVVKAALSAGHDVIGLRRPASSPGEFRAANLTWLYADLRQSKALAGKTDGIDAVIHCAAATSGDLPTQLAGTVLATENLLAQLPSSLRRIIHVSSLSVYDFDAPRRGGILSEDSPLERDPLRRDAYTQTKLVQENLVRDFAASQNVSLVVARPGAIYGPHKTWDWGRGLAVGRFDLIFAPAARMRLIHVENCADALVKALDLPLAAVLTVNLIDPEQPSHWRYHKLARENGIRTGTAVPLPYVGVAAVGWAARLASKLFFRGRARLPELLDLPRQRARWRPLRYSSLCAESVLPLQDRVSLQAGVAEMAASPSPAIQER